MIPVLVAVIAVALDQISKYLVSSSMEPKEVIPVIDWLFELHYAQNKGASFGIFADNRLLFMIPSAIAIIAMAAFLTWLIIKKKPMFLQISLALLLAGGVGNMIDRIRLGYVIDFINPTFVNFAIFNLADSFITIGSVLVVICLFTKRNGINSVSGDKNEETEETEDKKEKGQ
ncbi:lipoprotein signal peptidase [Clostridia bacterium]|nr:lipoprotein signal peptidase [Clostridia bacterium]